MTKPMVRIHDVDTDTVVDREMTDTEYAQYQLDQTQANEESLKEENKIKVKTELLNRLGITADEAKLLLS
jgi:hypothetical protein